MGNEDPKIDWQKRADDPNLTLESERMKLEAGWLGKVFGSHMVAPTNIAVLVTVVLGEVAILALFFETQIPGKDVLTGVASTLALALGYTTAAGARSLSRHILDGMRRGPMEDPRALQVLVIDLGAELRISQHWFAELEETDECRRQLYSGA